MPYSSLPILFVDGDAALRTVFIEHFQRNGMLVHGASTFDEARHIVSRQRIDMVIIDWDGNETESQQFASFMRATEPLLPIVALTEKTNLDEQIDAYSYGIDDYWIKPVPLALAVVKCRVLLRRYVGHTLTEAPFQLGDVTIDLKRRVVLRNGEPVTLNEKEFGIIRALALEDGAPVRRETLLARVWGYESLPITRTVDNYIVSLRRKIERNPSDPEYLLTVGGVGYRLKR